MLLLFGVRPASLVIAAVVIYRAISLWVPALIGSLAFLSLRREIGKPIAPAGRGLGAASRQQARSAKRDGSAGGAAGRRAGQACAITVQARC